MQEELTVRGKKGLMLFSNKEKLIYFQHQIKEKDSKKYYYARGGGGEEEEEEEVSKKVTNR